jgi:hypothetical protein
MRQFENARLSIRVSVEPDSNAAAKRKWQERKRSRQRTSTDDGIQIDFNALDRQNARVSIRVSFELDSNVNFTLGREVWTTVPIRQKVGDALEKAWKNKTFARAGIENRDMQG